MKYYSVTRAVFVVMVASLLAGPVFGQVSIGVTPPGGGLNGTNHSLEVTYPGGVGGEAVVVSTHPTNERTFNVSFYINANNIDLCTGPACRLFIYRAWGNREGSISDVMRVGLKQQASGDYRVLLWYKDRDVVGNGSWVQINGPFLSNGTTDHKITVEWTAASDGADDGTIRILRDDVLVNAAHAVIDKNMPFDIDNNRMGHTNGAVRSGATGSMFMDEFVSTR